ncbi:MAG: ribbon-helix-helix domain-containing protein [Candidatus Bathyarchaeia archaeon]
MAIEEKSKDEYTTIRLPKELMDEVRKLVGVRGFRSSSEVVKQALREYLDECYRRGIIQ